MNYLLMNKDTQILLFRCERNEFEEVETRELTWFSDLVPQGYTDLAPFLDRRKAPKHRKHIEELLERFNCNDTEGFLRITHALSLNDTFWVKEEGSDLTWQDVSLYHNEFDELVSAAAFDGHFSSTSLSSTSPEFGTDGYYAKCWVREEEKIYLYKTGSNTFEIEPLSEFLASQLAQKICPEAVSYDLDFYHGKLISKCKLFTSEAVGLVKAYDVLERNQRSVAEMLRYFESIGSGEAFRRMCILDALILNTDRHLGNFGVLVNNDTMEVLGMAPVYDNNRSLLFDMDMDQLTKRRDWCIQKCQPRFGIGFIPTAKGMLTDQLRAELEQLPGFAFQQHPYISAEQERLDILSEIVNRQIEQILL
ncbi:MAG: HipA protein [Oscillospiraceae bacterium]|nr:HipA protein [Oscillospiraceae bacterium]